MAERTDYILDDEGNWKIANGDFVSGESLVQEVGEICDINQGEYKNNPLIGPNLVMLVNSNSSSQDIQEKIRQHLKLDGIEFEKVKHHIATLIEE